MQCVTVIIKRYVILRYLILFFTLTLFIRMFFTFAVSCFFNSERIYERKGLIFIGSQISLIVMRSEVAEIVWQYFYICTKPTALPVTLRTRFCNAGENTSMLALTPPSLTRSRSMQQQTQIYQLTNHHWTRLPVPSVNYEIFVQPALMGFHPSYSYVQLIRSRIL